MLIALELTSLIVLSNRREPGVVVRQTPARSRFAPGGCNAVVFSTYWKVVKYLKDFNHPPTNLNELVPKYLDKVPMDPATGKPLAYSTDGKQFHLNCR